MGFLKEFKEFALKGNVVDMAVGVIVGGAFGTIVGSVINDLFMPILGIFTGGISFNELFIALDGAEYVNLAAAQEAGAPIFAYGNFIQNVIQFIVLAFIVFLFVKAMNKAKKPAPAPAVTTKVCPYCASEIPLAAVKCAHCASDLPDYPQQ